MKIVWAIISTIGVAPFMTGPASGQERGGDRYFNNYVHAAYLSLLGDPSRSGRGYHISKWFTKNLDYGSRQGAITAKEPPLIMCNAAVTETIVEAINLYAAKYPTWLPESAIPAESWNKFQWTMLKPHLFSHDFMGYPPLEGIPVKEMPAPLVRQIRQFHSEQGMAKALVKFGLGEFVDFPKAEPGDVITFDRDHANIDGTERYSGHSVIFLGFLGRDQEERKSYSQDDVVGFKYFSSQGTREKGGLGERWAYFKDIMCPYADGYQLPGCADAVSSQTNRNRFPAQKSGKPRDCCVKRAGSDGLRVGRLWAPPRWTYGASQKRVATEYADLEKQVLEYVRRREKMRIALTLLAKGAVALEAKQSPEAGTFLRRVETETGVDLRSIAGGGQSVALDGRSIRRIQELAPTAVTREANSLVSSPGRAQIARQVQEAAASAQERMRSALIEGVSNPKLNGNSTD